MLRKTIRTFTGVSSLVHDNTGQVVHGVGGSLPLCLAETHIQRLERELNKVLLLVAMRCNGDKNEKLIETRKKKTRCQDGVTQYAEEQQLLEGKARYTN